ncbi:MAG TPA: protease HtpX [Candidatus Obscuribacterales bacterium]
MAIARRVGLFLLVNFLVITTVSVLLSVLGVRPYLTEYGLDIPQLALFCGVWGMGGAFISLALSRWTAKWSYGVQLIDSRTTDPVLSNLIETVHRLARQAGLSTMPEVGIYDSPELNAFATGPTRNRALVAVSTGLLTRMRRDEIEGVIGHELSHVANGDMVTMTLLQGIVNAFVMFLSRAIAFVLTRDRDSRGGSWAYFGVTMVLQIVFMILGSIVVAWFSRWREFRADAGGARLAGREKMVNALEALRRHMDEVDPSAQPALATMKIASKPTGIWRLFSTHPPLEERIARLSAAAERAS